MSTSGEDQTRSHHLSQFKFHLLHSHSHSHSRSHFSSNPPPPSSSPHSPFPNPFLSQTYEQSRFKSLRSNVDVVPPTLTPNNTLQTQPQPQPQPAVRGKLQTKSKVVRNNTKAATNKSNTESPNSTAVNNCRYDSSLGLLTKKFVSLIEEATDGTLDLNKTAEVLEVQKRRIYDITNVLEGIGLIEKTSKNHIRWKGCDGHGPRELEEQVARLEAEVKSLYAEESVLDDCIRTKQELLRNLEESENSRKYLYLTKEDILSLPCFQGQELIVIKAPKASSIEVPYPDEELGFRQRQYKMTVRSATGPIYQYLLSVKQVKLEDPSWNSVHRRIRGMGSLESQDDLKNPSQSFRPLGSEAFGIQQITPTDLEINDDYWFQSDPGVTLSELWGTSNKF